MNYKKLKILVFLFFIFEFTGFSQPVMKNPGIPKSESYVIKEYLSAETGYVTSNININLNEKNNIKYYTIVINEGGLFRNEININYSDLTTISEKRIDLKNNKVVQYFIKTNDTIHFYNKEKNIDKIYKTDETNIYSPLAYFVSFRGFPFKAGKQVSFKTYMYVYGGELTMNLEQVDTKTVTNKTGTYNCNILELSVGGWQSIFAPDKYYFYFSTDPPYRLIKYEEKINGKWISDELISYSGLMN